MTFTYTPDSALLGQGNDPTEWTKQDGRVLKIVALSNEHLFNIVRYIQRERYKDREKLPQWKTLMKEVDKRGINLATSVAYVVGIINTDEHKMVGAGIFSEPTPTLSGRLWPFTIFHTQANSYDEAHKEALAVIDKSGHYDWVKPLLSDRDRRTTL